MLQNYFKIALRSLFKNPVYSFINIAGLSIGIASSVLIFLWVADEYAYDHFHKNYDSIYKLYQSQQWADDRDETERSEDAENEASCGESAGFR